MKKLLLILSIFLAMVNYAKADNFVTDVMVIGGTQAETDSLKTQYQNQGWTVVNQDLNEGAGGDYIYLLYKTDTDANPDATFITYFTWFGFYTEGVMNPSGITYYPVAYAGGSQFVASQGNLNSGTTSGCPLYLYYTKDANGGTDNPHLVKSITFNSNSEGAMPNIDLNFECGGNAPEIYMHPDITQGWVFWQGNDTECIILAYDGPKAWITSYTVPTTHDGLNVIAADVFNGFINLETLIFPYESHVTDMPSMQGCTNLQHVNVRLNNNVYQDDTPLSMTSIPDYAFYGTAVTTIILRAVTNVGDYAFEGCNLSSIAFNQSNVQIGNRAFANISRNCTVTYSGSVDDWSPNAYVYSPNLVVNASDGSCGWCGGAGGTSENYLYWTLDNATGHLNIDWLWQGSPEQQVISSHNWNNNNVHSLTLNHVYGIGEDAFSGYTNLTSVTIPNSVTSIGQYAFSGCIGLTSVTIPNSVTVIGDNAFENCSSLTSVTIPNSVTSIRYCAFQGCTGLTSVTIPNSVTTIDWHVFYGCTGLTSVNIPNSVTSIDELAFGGCSNITSVNINSNAILSESSSLKNIFGSQVTNYTIGNDVTSIGEHAFYGCSGLTSITIPNSVTSIGVGAFNGCTGLTSVTINSPTFLSINYSASSSLKHIFGNQVTNYTIGNDVTDIGNYAFFTCTGLTSVTIGNSVTSIREAAFSYCTGLTSVTIPNSVTTIWNHAFNGCSSLKDLYFDGTKAQWNTVTKGEDWNSGVSSNYKEHWRCTVTFNANGHGTAPDPQTNLWSNESKATQPTAPTESGYVFTGWYTDAQCTTPWNFGTDVVPDDMTLYAGWDLEVEGLQGSGTDEDPYLISNNGEWIWFAQSVTDGTTYAGQTVKLTADIAATVMAGSHSSETDYHAFSGTFDGDGHTINLTLSGSGHGTALFYHLGDATLKNLKVQGSVTTIGYRPATFASIINGNSTISNCWSTVAVSSTRANDWVDGGGFVGRVSTGASLNMTDCAFYGTVTFDSTATTGGGMVGYTQSNATVNLTDCLYSPSALTLNVSQYNPRVFVSGQVSGNLTNCYYNAVAAASVLENQGIDASGMTNAALAAALGEGWHVYNDMVVPFTGKYYISSAAEWNAFATAVNNGTSYSGQIVALTTDIPTAVTTMAGTESNPFCGTFDGDGHTITLALSGSGQGTALFYLIEGATLKNLKVQGTVTTSGYRPATFTAFVEGNSTISNCWSTVAVSSTKTNSWVDGGGFVGRVSSNATLNMTGCAFHGSVTFDSTATTGGGMVGFTQTDAVVNLTNCLYSPTELTLNVSQYYPRIFVSGYVPGNLNNCYYNAVAANSALENQGKLMHSIAGDSNVTVAFDGEATAYDLSGISAYSVGIVYDSTLYAGNGETVNLNLSCTPPTDYNIIGYTATAGTLTGTANPYTLTMPNEAVTIQAVLGQPPVPYIDENGVEQQCTFYTVVTDTLDFYDLPAGWYVVNNDFTHNGPALIFGDAHLILCDGAMMNISYGGSGTAINTYGSLTLYGQSEGTGSLSATSNNGKGISVTNLMTINGCTVTASGGDSQGIYATNLTINGSTVTATGSSIGISSIDLTINGSTVTASANDDGGMGISANRVTINSGTVNATGNDSGIYIGNEYGYVTINGGTVTVTGDYGIYSPTVTLGWSILTDSITVGNFDYYDTPIVSVKSGQAFYYEDNGRTVVVSGTLNQNQINAIGGKTLFPYVPPVDYIDENGEEQKCTIYTFVTNDLDFGNLPAGWYVVNDDITINDWVHFSGDAHLILCDYVTMNIRYIGEALHADSSLTLYGQSGGTGSLTATSTDIDGIHAPNLTINTCTVTATGNSNGISLLQNLTINGGTVTASGSLFGIIGTDLTINGSSVTATSSNEGIHATNLTINGSTVTASGSLLGIIATDLTINGSSVTATSSNNYGICANRLTINSGTVNATGNGLGISIGNASGYVIINGGTVTTNKIYSPRVTLGWSNLNDSITVGSFAYSGTPTVSVKSGQAFYYLNGWDKNYMNTVVISGTLTAEEIAAIGGKTLRPYIEPCAPPFDLEVTDIGATTATLHWMGVQDSYNVRYRPANRSVEWFEAAADTTTLDLTNLEPETEYAWEVQGIDCDGNGGTTEWSEWAFFTTEELTTVTQTTELVAGWNWFSTNVEITLDYLKAALVAALPGTNIKITSQSNGTTTYNGIRWRGQLNSMDLAQMYMVEVTADCEVTLEGMPVNPDEHPVTIHNGSNWVAFPLSGSMSLTDAFAGFVINGDKVTSQSNGSATYTNRWRGQLTTLESGKGYIYESAATGDRTFTFPISAK